MIHFETELRNTIANACRHLFNSEIEADKVLLGQTKKEFVGDITLVVFPYLQASQKSPEATAQLIGDFLVNHSTFVKGFNVVKGFLNIEIKDSFWIEYYNQLIILPLDRWYTLATKAAGRMMVEYSSPNTNKPLHLGHIRNNLLGYSVAELLKATGHQVIKANLVNDRGIHICKSMLAWKLFGHGETPESTGLKGDHLVGKYYVEFDRRLKEELESLMKKGFSEDGAMEQSQLMVEVKAMLLQWEAGDKDVISLWQTMNGWVYKGFEETYNKLGVDFDKTYYESQTYLLGKKVVEEGLSAGVFYEKEDKSVWVDLTESGLDHKLLLRADGTSVYITQDLGTAQLRFTEYPNLEKLIYVVGNEQEYHFKVLKEIFKKLKRPWADGLYHLSYGMVDLPSGKMKSREGTVVDADDLIKEITESAEMTTKALGKLDDYNSADALKLYHDIGMGALKYFILKVDPKKRMLFNPAESIDLNGNTGPFIQYTHARIQSVLRKAQSEGLPGTKPYSGSMTADEKNIIQLIYRYSEMLNDAAKAYSPAVIANYCYELAKAFNHFYHDHIIVDFSNREVSDFRIGLSRSCAGLISKLLALLGIESPDRM